MPSLGKKWHATCLEIFWVEWLWRKVTYYLCATSDHKNLGMIWLIIPRETLYWKAACRFCPLKTPKEGREICASVWFWLLLLIPWMWSPCNVNSWAECLALSFQASPVCRISVMWAARKELRSQPCQLCQGALLWGFHSLHTLDM